MPDSHQYIAFVHAHTECMRKMCSRCTRPMVLDYAGIVVLTSDMQCILFTYYINVRTCADVCFCMFRLV